MGTARAAGRRDAIGERARRRRGPTVRATACAVAVVVALTGCQTWVLTYDGGGTPQVALLTPDGDDGYGFTSSSTGLHVAALGTNDGTNLRALFWPSGSPVVADAQSCAIWTSQSGPVVQQGAALRIRRSTGRLRAVTVTKNIVYGISWVFNFHTWDTDRAQPFQQFGSVEIPGVRHRTSDADLPWNVCARTMGRTIELKVWTDEMAEPRWGDPTWGGSATIPLGWETAGTTGWFAGHLSPGEHARFDRLRTWRSGTTGETRSQPTDKPGAFTSTTPGGRTPIAAVIEG